MGDLSNDLSHERWFQLCQLATVEHDSEKIVAMVAEINRLLQEKEDAVSANRNRVSQRYELYGEIAC
jgi:hypothetical protein